MKLMRIRNPVTNGCEYADPDFKKRKARELELVNIKIAEFIIYEIDISFKSEYNPVRQTK